MIYKFLRICLLGDPNVGKSTFFNSLIGYKVSIITRKQHTTRNIVEGIFQKKNTQLLFVDTPGYLSNPFHLIEKKIAYKALREIKKSNFICIILDVTKINCFNTPLLRVKLYLKKFSNIIIILNKIDLLKNKNILLNYINKIKIIPIRCVFFISAKYNNGIYEFQNYLLNNSFITKYDYKKNNLTNMSKQKLSEDITREKLYKYYNQEIPYNLFVKTKFWKEKKNIILIYQIIYVLEKNQKKLIIGNKGLKIQKIRIKSIYDITRICNKKISLKILVKVKHSIL